MVVGKTPVEVGPGILRVKVDGLGVVGDGFLVLAKVVICIAAVVVGRGILRIELDGLGVVCQGLG